MRAVISQVVIMWLSVMWVIVFVSILRDGKIVIIEPNRAILLLELHVTAGVCLFGAYNLYSLIKGRIKYNKEVDHDNRNL